MNQILSVEQPVKKKRKTKNSGPIEIEKIVRFFAIAMIIFGIVIISSASYAMYKGTQLEKITFIISVVSSIMFIVYVVYCNKNKQLSLTEKSN